MVVGWEQQAAAHGTCAEGVEEISADINLTGLHRLRTKCHERGAEGDSRQALDASRALREIDVVRRREGPGAEGAGMRRRAMHGDETFWVAEGQRLKKGAADRARDRGGGADPEGEAQHAGEGNGRSPEQSTGGRTDVGEHRAMSR